MHISFTDGFLSSSWPVSHLVSSMTSLWAYKRQFAFLALFAFPFSFDALYCLNKDLFEARIWCSGVLDDKLGIDGSIMEFSFLSFRFHQYELSAPTLSYCMNLVGWPHWDSTFTFVTL